MCICMCVGGRDRMYEPITPFSSFSFICIFSYKKFPYFLSTVSPFIHCFAFISFSFHCDIFQISFFLLIIFNSELYFVCVCLFECVFLYLILIQTIIFFPTKINTFFFGSLYKFSRNLKKEKKNLVLCVRASSYLREIQSIRVCVCVSMSVCVVSEKDEEVQNVERKIERKKDRLNCRKMI